MLRKISFDKEGFRTNGAEGSKSSVHLQETCQGGSPELQTCFNNISVLKAT